MPTQTPTLAEILERAMHDRLRDSFGGWLPARIESYDSTTNRATVQILLLDDYEDEEGDRQTEPFPPVSDIPVAWLSLGGRFAIRSPVTAGDEGMYMMPARPTGKWLQTGGMVDPEDDDHHPLDGGVFLPYRISSGGSNADPLIEFTATEIRAGGTKNLVTREEFIDHSHPTAATGPPSAPQRIAGSPPTIPPLATGTTGFPGTQKLKGG